MRLLRGTATALAGLAAAAVLATAVLLAVFRPGAAVVWSFAWLAAGGLLTVVVGLVVAWRAPANRIGALLCWAGAVIVFIAARPAYETMALRHPGALPLDLRVVVAFEEAAWWLWVAAALVLLYFPDGRLPGPRWRPVPYLLVAFGAITQAYGVVEPVPLLEPLQDLARPYPPPPTAVRVVADVAFFGLLALVVACLASVVVRYRRSSGAKRAQLKWLSLVGVAFLVYPLACVVEILTTGRTGAVSTVLAALLLFSLPVSVGVGMLRHDLYDVDRALAAGVTYIALTAALVGVFAASVVAAGVLLGRDSPAAAAIATAVSALALAPLRGRIQRWVDRRFYPPRRAALLAIGTLQQRIHAGEAQPEELEDALRAAVRDPALRVGLRLPGTANLVDARGEPVTEPRLVPVLLGGEQVGVLVSGDDAGVAVLRAIAPATASLVEVMRLRSELASALREVRESRARLVQAGNAERVRLERDLHDGAQQRLVSLGMAMRVAQIQLASGTAGSAGSADVHGLLDRAVVELATAIAELRQIAHGLRPTSLDDGLHAALSGMTRALPIPVRLDVDAGELPDDLATTAYYVACEAMTNAAKHAGAGSVAVRVDRVAQVLRIRVEDDGRGGAAMRPGSGLAGLVDRVAALGGSMTMLSPTGGGTVIEAELPCAS